jgi:hypothetical protein
MQACSFGMEGPLMFLAWFAPNLFLLTASTSGCANTTVIPVRPGRRHIVTHLCGSPQRPFLWEIPVSAVVIDDSNAEGRDILQDISPKGPTHPYPHNNPPRLA